MDWRKDPYKFTENLFYSTSHNLDSDVAYCIKKLYDGRKEIFFELWNRIDLDKNNNQWIRVRRPRGI